MITLTRNITVHHSMEMHAVRTAKKAAKTWETDSTPQRDATRATFDECCLQLRDSQYPAWKGVKEQGDKQLTEQEARLFKTTAQLPPDILEALFRLTNILEKIAQVPLSYKIPFTALALAREYHIVLAVRKLVSNEFKSLKGNRLKKGYKLMQPLLLGAVDIFTWQVRVQLGYQTRSPVHIDTIKTLEVGSTRYVCSRDCDVV